MFTPAGKPPLPKLYNVRKARGCVTVSPGMIGCRVRNLGSYAPGGRVPNQYVYYILWSVILWSVERGMYKYIVRALKIYC